MEPQAPPPFPAYKGTAPFIIVCYAEADTEIVYPEITRLRDHGFNIWYEEGISSGANWRSETAEALSHCQLFLFYITPEWLASAKCRKELDYALAHDRPMITVHLQQTRLPPDLYASLADVPSVRKEDHTESDYEAKLSGDLQSLLPSTLPQSSQAEEGRAQRTPWTLIKTLLLPVFGLIYLAWKLKALLFAALKLPILKFIPIILKTGGTMMLSLWFYVVAWGVWFGVGIVYLLFVHELGHLLAARRLGIKVGAPVFIPFMGAVIAMKEAPKNAWIEAQIGIGGPLLGAVSAVLVHGLYLASGNKLFAAVAYTGYFLNLFNLTPVGVLDGGRVVPVLSRWLWVLGFAIMAWLLYVRFNPIILIVLMLGLPRAISLFRKQTEEEEFYVIVTPRQRWTMAALYFGLIGLLSVGMLATMVTP